jgi:SPW repeat
MNTARESARESATDRISFLRTHRTWEDWSGIALSLAVILSPWMARQSGDAGVVMVTALLGLMLLTLAQYELVKAHRSVELIELACGVVVMALPFLLDYAGAGQLRTWHFVLGALIASLAVLELWQGWQRPASGHTPSASGPAVSTTDRPMHGDVH